MFGCFLNTNATLPELLPSLAGIASSSEGVYFVPVGCSGMQFFHHVGPALPSVFAARQIPHSLCGYRTAEFPTQQ